MILEPAVLTASGRPVLRPQEVELLILDKVDLEFTGRGGLSGHQAEAYKGGYVVLTSQRLIWLTNSTAGGPSAQPGAGHPCCLPVHSVRDVQKKNQMAFSGTKVRLQLNVAANFEGKPVDVNGQFHQTCELRLRCRGDGPESLMAKLQEAMRSKPPAPAPSAGALHHGSQLASAGGAGAAAAAPGHARTPSPAQPVPQQQPVVDDQLLQQLVDMGFPRNRAARSLLATKNVGCQEAIDYMLAFGEQPGMDEPLQQAQPGAAWLASQGPAPRPSADYFGVSSTAPGPIYGQDSHGMQQQQYVVPEQASAYPAIMPYDVAPSQQPYSHQQASAEATATTYAPFSNSYGSWQSQQQQQQQQLQQQPMVHAEPRVMDGNRATFGVAGIVRREEQKASDAGRTLSVAFQDLQALMGMAADMVKLAERLRGYMSQPGKSNEEELMDRDTQLELIEMGISSPVTKESAGARYNIELSRQLADFLAKPLQQAGGIMTLPDVYCLYNRARGTELVSPDDLLQSISMFSQLGLPLKLHKLPSGLPVVQSAAHSEAEVCACIAQLVAPSAATEDLQMVPRGAHLGPAITATDVARALAVSLPIAKEHLLTAELKGVLCRDDGPEGLRFYHNFFAALQRA